MGLICQLSVALPSDKCLSSTHVPGSMFLLTWRVSSAFCAFSRGVTPLDLLLKKQHPCFKKLRLAMDPLSFLDKVISLTWPSFPRSPRALPSVAYCAGLLQSGAGQEKEARVLIGWLALPASIKKSSKVKHSKQRRAAFG